MEPNFYELYGDRLRVTYYPKGSGGPLKTGDQPNQPKMIYSDGGQDLVLKGSDLQIVSMSIGKIVTGKIRSTIDTGATFFSLIVPDVNLEDKQSTPIQTNGIITIERRSPILTLNIGQLDSYTNVELTGVASIIMLPL